NISAGPLWKTALAIPGPSSGVGDSISSSAWDGSTLYASAGITKINGTKCAGSLKALRPDTGALLWAVCLAQDAKDPVTAVPGVVVLGVGTSIVVVDAKSGGLLFSYQDTLSTSNFWGAASISNGMLYEGNKDGFVYAFG